MPVLQSSFSEKSNPNRNSQLDQQLRIQKTFWRIPTVTVGAKKSFRTVIALIRVVLRVLNKAIERRGIVGSITQAIANPARRPDQVEIPARFFPENQNSAVN